MIDIHAHILPGMDDGAADMEEALDMVRAAASVGVGAIVATPHVYNPFQDGLGAELEAAVAALRASAARQEPNVKILPGGELAMEPGIVEVVGRNHQLTVGGAGKYVLMEFPMFQMPRFSSTLVLDMKLKGLVPVIAHPERCWEVRREPGMVKGLVERGALLQINAGSLLGRYGSDVEEAALFLVREGFAHILASDGHCAESIAALLEGRKVVEELCGADVASRLTETTPERVAGLGNEKIERFSLG